MPIQFVIQRNDDGSVSVSGPIEDKTLAYGLLECAKDAIRDFVVSQQKLVQPVGAMPTIVRLREPDGNGGNR